MSEMEMIISSAPEIPLGYRRLDGSAVGIIEGNPYHFTPDSRFWDDVKDRIGDLPLQEALPDGRLIPDYVDGALVTDEAHLPEPFRMQGPETPVVVSARQFKLQLLASGLYETVEAWVATQPLPVRIAYDNSATFLRDDKTLVSGFKAMGVTKKQIDDFFAAALLL